MSSLFSIIRFFKVFMCLASSLKLWLMSQIDQPLSLVKNWNVGFSISTNIIAIGPFRSDANFLKGYIIASLWRKAHCWVICMDLKFSIFPLSFTSTFFFFLLFSFACTCKFNFFQFFLFFYFYFYFHLLAPLIDYF